MNSLVSINLSTDSFQGFINPWLNVTSNLHPRLAALFSMTLHIAMHIIQIPVNWAPLCFLLLCFRWLSWSHSGGCAKYPCRCTTAILSSAIAIMFALINNWGGSVRLIFFISLRCCNIVHPKVKTFSHKQSNVVYAVPCSQDCNDLYIGETNQPLHK